jgi:hypothetical protein
MWYQNRSTFFQFNLLVLKNKNYCLKVHTNLLIFTSIVFLNWSFPFDLSFSQSTPTFHIHYFIKVYFIHIVQFHSNLSIFLTNIFHRFTFKLAKCFKGFVPTWLYEKNVKTWSIYSKYCIIIMFHYKKNCSIFHKFSWKYL